MYAKQARSHTLIINHQSFCLTKMSSWILAFKRRYEVQQDLLLREDSEEVGHQN